ncbi:arf-GAP with Rho-GAP domain, ANK repeat and PH domain-containing protein 2 [Electrophorus electricus]|uniref:arf-GAP with Rho-GAP domain, ANK repeat and PH domain-containing protein 2 n=1 Tax=Electrophorus electricus TaxID=8005 RepID=UPI0015D0BFC7|nr:arf-GAP with Rho-GAP domain, ANK repeat and PH domain-containing protein 2 [Electrophorus electricus]
MSSGSLDGSPHLIPMDPSEEIVLWLSSLHLPQYAASFTQAGYHTLGDCRGLTEEKLLEVARFPTGHRRRILHSLEVLVAGTDGGEVPEQAGESNKPTPLPRSVFLKDGKRVVSPQVPQMSGPREHENWAGAKSLPSRPHGETKARDDLGGPLADLPPSSLQKAPSASVPASLHSSSQSPWYSSWALPSDIENLSGEPDSFSTEPVAGVKRDFALDGAPEAFQGDMVINDIYESCSVLKAAGPRSSHSYRLRHRPVPEVPECTVIPLYDWSTCACTEQQSSAEAPCGPTSLQKAPSSSSAPYEEVYLYSSNSVQSKPDMGAKELLKQEASEKQRQKKQRKQKGKRGMERPGFSSHRTTSLLEDGYSLIQPCLPGQEPASDSSSKTDTTLKPLPPTVTSSLGAWPHEDESDIYSEPLDTVSGHTLLLQGDMDISPYACYYGGPKSSVKIGWLDKLSPQGNCVFQRRWVKFDGENLMYYNSDKDMYSKGLVPLSAIKQVRSVGENKMEVVTSLRTFVFRAEKEGERQDWLRVLQEALKCRSPVPHKPWQVSGGRSGYVELRGHKGRVYLSLTGTDVRLCKSEQDFNSGLAIAVVTLAASCVKQVDRRAFEINTPFKSFCFTAESEQEREEWVKAVQESIAETLSNYEVAEKVWFNQSNRKCADCRAPRPEWASINLVVVICKLCAGQHRFLGPGISQVRSLKLDISIWSNELVELFLEVGNDNANSFWAANLPLEEELHMGASPEQRATFHRRKYRERKYRRFLEGFTNQEELNQALCSAVLQSDVLETMALVFSGADVMCATGDPDHSTPYLLAQKGGQRLQMEFLYHNQLSEFAKLEMMGDTSFPVEVSSFMDGFLYSPANLLKTTATLDRKGIDYMIRRWCTLEGGYLSYYDSEKSAAAIGRVDINEVVSLAINNIETMTAAGAVFTFEIYLESEKLLVFGAETSDTQKDWAHAIAKCFVPMRVESLMKKDYERIGCLYYKEGHDLYRWRIGWFSLVGSELFFCSDDEPMSKGILQLKRLQELTVSTHSEGEEKTQVLLMVESGRTIYMHGINKQDFALWYSAIQLAAGRDGRALSNQQLTKNDVPIIIDSCMAFVTQYGLCHQDIYQRNGDPKRVAELLEEFSQDARNVKLRAQDHRLEDVTDTLKRFLSQCEDALLAKELYPYWISALDEVNEEGRIEKYSTYIQSLPKVNRSTLAALLQHLYRIQSCSHINQMKSASLACVFSSCLFQTGGHAVQETRVVEDLINNYVQLFSVNEEQVRQMERENSFITRWKDTTFSPAGDLIFEVYLEKKEPGNCCLIKVSPTMHSDELADNTLQMKGIDTGLQDLWTTFEVIENGELERPLHYRERVLEQVLEWCTLEDPTSAFLLIKKFPVLPTSSTPEDLKDYTKGEQLRFNDGSSKLLSGHKFQDRYLLLRDKKLLLHKDSKSTKPEREVPVESVKCYLGLRKKLKPPSNWGFTIHTQKQQWYFCCEGKDSQLEWVTAIIKIKYGEDLWISGRKGISRPSVPWSSREHHPPHWHADSMTAKGSKEDNSMAGTNVPAERARAKNSDEADSKYNTAMLEGCLMPTDQTGNTRTGAGERNCPLPSDKGVVKGPRHPVLGDHGRPPHKGAMYGCAVGHMQQSLLKELSTVLSQTRRVPREES